MDDERASSDERMPEAVEAVDEAESMSDPDAEARLTTQIHELEELIQEHPVVTVLVAASVGLVAGLVLGRR